MEIQTSQDQQVQIVTNEYSGISEEEYREIVLQRLDNIQELQKYETGFSLFLTVVILLTYSYRFLKMFF